MDLLSKSVDRLEVVQLNPNNETEVSKEILDNLLEHSSRGNPAAQFTLAQHYLNNSEAAKALVLFEQSAASGYNQAVYQLAVMYYDGIGTDSDSVSPLVVTVAMYSQCT